MFLAHETKAFFTRFTFLLAQVCYSGNPGCSLITSHLEGLSNSKRFMCLPQDSFFAVELDTCFDPVVDDLNGSHVRIELKAVESVDSFKAGIDLVGRNEVVKVVNKPPGPVLEAQIDHSKQFKELVYVGFCTLNGKVSCACIVKSWNGSLPFVITMHFWEEQDCFMRGDTCARSSRPGFRVDTSRVPTSLFREEISSAAIGFDRGRIVGEGASAKVCKWCLLSGGDVVVKRFEKANVLSHLLGPFTSELATMAGCIWHKNLVQPHGWCCEVNELVLVYDLMPNGSFSQILHRSFNLVVVLSWYVMQSLGVASAVAYLHEEYCERQIIQTDVRIGNIIVDAEFNAKPGDCGLAEAYEHSSITRMGYLFIQHVFSGVPTVKKDVCSFIVVVIDVAILARTMGNIALECVSSGGLTVKTDVCSFGTVLLKVATGTKPMEDDGTMIVDWLWRLWEVKKLIEAACWLTGRFDKVEMGRMLMSGLACAHQNHAKRPTLEAARRSATLCIECQETKGLAEVSGAQFHHKKSNSVTSCTCYLNCVLP